MFVRAFCALFIACLLIDIADANFTAIFSNNMQMSNDGADIFTGENAEDPTTDDEGEDSVYSDDDDSDDPRLKLFEGDIVYDPHVHDTLNDIVGFDAATDMQWTDNTVPYVIATGHELFIEKAINNAIKKYDEQLDNCIKWVKYQDRRALREAKIENYVLFFVGRFCYSSIGMIGGQQRISLGNGCLYRGTVMHEMMHALGFWHEQSRLDRNDHIEIYDENVDPKMMYNFNKYKIGEAQTLDEPYDIKSIMHYPPRAFSKNNKIVIKHKHGVKKFGWAQELSQIDINQLRKYYECDKVVNGKVTSADPKSVTPLKTPIHGGWSRWGKWSKCSKPCGGGIREITRECNNPTPANGGKICNEKKKKVTKACNTGACTKAIDARVDGKWSKWTKWTKCSKTCGGGTRYTQRFCNNPRPSPGGKTCLGDGKVTIACSKQACPRWSDWMGGDCSKSCGGGVRIYTRKCEGPIPTVQYQCTGPNSLTRSCKNQKCLVAGCANLNPKCPIWLKYCNKGNYVDYMKKNCKLTCGLC